MKNIPANNPKKQNCASKRSGVREQRMARLLREHRAVTAAVWDYHHALDTRQDGSVAGYRLIAAVEAALGKHWKRGAILKKPSEKLSHAAESERGDGKKTL